MDAPGVLFEGATFTSKESFQLEVYKLLKRDHRPNPKVRGSDSGRCTMVCLHATDGCPFKAIARLDKHRSVWKLTTLELSHGPSCDELLSTGPIPTKLVAYGLASSNFALDRSSQIRTACEETLDYVPSHHQAKRLKSQLLDRTSAEVLMSYQRLPALLARVLDSNPGSHTQLHLSDKGNEFQSLFISLGAHIRMSPLCPAVVTLDACHLDTHMHGTMFLAVQMDPNHSYFPLGIGINAGNESEESWTAFLEDLRRAVPSIGETTVFVSGRDKGLAKSIPAVFPGACHRYCLRHLEANVVIGKLGAQTKALIHKLAYTQTIPKFEAARDAFLNDEESPPSDAQRKFLQSIPPQNYCRAYIKCRTYDIFTNNQAESANSVFKDLRALPIDELVLGVVNWCAQRFVRCLDDTKRLNIRPRSLVPHAASHMEKMRKEGKAWKVVIGSDFHYVANDATSWKVTLKSEGGLATASSCPCYYYTDTGLPCVHMSAVANLLNVELHPIVDDMYRAFHYIKIYEEGKSLNGVVLTHEDAVSKEISTPNVPKPRGRQRSKSFIETSKKGSSTDSAEQMLVLSSTRSQ